jgi:hypothetical protein
MPAAFQVTPHPGAVTAIARLNIRRGLPTISAPVARKVEPGTVLAVTGLVTGDAVRANDQWYAGDAGTFFWSGACSDFQSAATEPAPGMKVHKRPNGTVLPLSDADLAAVFGKFAYTEGAGGRIRPDPAWVAANIVNAPVPSLAAIGHPQIELHMKAAAIFARIFAAIEAAGLTGRILTFDGTYVPRHKGWNPHRGLSSHSWGVTIDLNARWNPYQTDPAPIGTHGSVRELVPFFAAEGCAWGGHFSPPYQDGMHFELARYDL